MKRIENKIAIITGGADGIGKAAATRFAHEGATVLIWDMNEAKGAETVADIVKNGGTAEFAKVNTAKFEEVEKATNDAIAKHKKIDILVNNAGITRDASLKKMTPQQWQEVIDVNLTGVFNCAKCVSGFMVEKGYGRIINTSSVVALYGNFGQTNYVATKAGLIGMTKTLGKELGRKGVTVNAVAPGFIATDMVSINTCIMVDFTGQVASESIGTKQYSGTGGQTDTAVGAVEGFDGLGKSIIACRATARNGQISTIVPTLPEGTAVTLHRSHTDYVVTEWGSVRLTGLTVKERTKALISIAHPKFRDELTAQAEKLGYI
jgi:Dehydrogenases with different specificities (related to short-chain alcohol dehydrogenases)